MAFCSATTVYVVVSRHKHPIALHRARTDHFVKVKEIVIKPRMRRQDLSLHSGCFLCKFSWHLFDRHINQSVEKMLVNQFKLMKQIMILDKFTRV